MFAIGAAATNVSAQPSNFTINTSNMTAGSAVLNCANGRSLTMADINKGQTCSNTSPTPTPSASSNNTTVTPTPTPAVTKPTMTTYKDPQGRFTVSYPTNWTATPASNRFESPLVKFNSGVGPNAIIDIVTVQVPDPEVFATQIANTGLFQYTLFQNVECTKYKIDGQRACSLIFTKQADADLGTPGVAIMSVISYVRGNMYTIGFAAPQDRFDPELPTFEAMISSFKAGS
jgi:hypothetical protein